MNTSLSEAIVVVEALACFAHWCRRWFALSLSPLRSVPGGDSGLEVPVIDAIFMLLLCPSWWEGISFPWWCRDDAAVPALEGVAARVFWTNTGLGGGMVRVLVGVFVQ